MSTADWLFWAQIAQGVGAIASAVVSGGIAYALYLYTKRRDKLDFLRTRWTEQQNINIHQLGSDDDLKTLETMIYGDKFPLDMHLVL